MGRKPVPRSSFFDRCDYLGFVHGERRWRDRKLKRLYTWDALHGEIEMFNLRGEHVGTLDAVTGKPLGGPVQGRRVDV